MNVPSALASSILALVLAASADAATPGLLLTLDRATMWPPDHRMVDVGLVVRYRDACGCVRKLLGGQFDVSVTQNEPVEDIGDGAQ